jgi:hypothetical protein
MHCNRVLPGQIVRFAFMLWLGCRSIQAPAVPDHPSPALPRESIAELNGSLKVGDVVALHVTPLPFREVSQATGSWVNHVGIVVDLSAGEATVAESTFPVAKLTKFSSFVARSDAGRVAVMRLKTPISDEAAGRIRTASSTRLGIRYDTGFNLDSPQQFCSKFVRQVLQDATGMQVGQVETFRELLGRNPDADLGFWRLWYHGAIPWERRTVTPASLVRSPDLIAVFDGFAR